MSSRLPLALLLCSLITAVHSGDKSGVHLSAYYYPWYDSDGRHWEEGYAGQSKNDGPALGLYSSRDPQTIVKHVNWSLQLGVTNWIAAWWGKDSWEDVTLKYRVAPILDQLKDSNSQRPMTFCIFYESEGLLGLDPETGIEFDYFKTRKLIDDFDYLANTYFSHPSYYRINDRPVVYLYLSRTFTGKYSAAIDRIRSNLKSKEIDIYLVGDEVYWGAPVIERISKFDAITAYNMHGPEPHFESPGDWTSFINDCGNVYRQYQSTAKNAGVAFIPGIIPGFNSHDADPSKQHYIIPKRYRMSTGTETTTIEQFTRIASETLDPTLKAAALTSFNEWHEGTQMEPSKKGSEVFPSLLDFLRGSPD